MKPFSEVLKEYLNLLVNELRRTNSEDVIVEVASDLKFNVQFKILMEELVIYCLEHDLLINSFAVLKYVPREYELRVNSEGIIPYTSIRGLKEKKDENFNEENYEEVGPHIFAKGSLYLMLERMGLDKSKKFLKKKKIIEDKYADGGDIVDASDYYSEEEIKSFNPDNFEIILQKELEEKYKNKPIIIEYNK